MELTKNDIKIINSLRMKKYRDQYGLFAVEGFKVVSELLKSTITIKYIVITGSLANDDKVKELMSLASKDNVPVYVVKDKEYNKLSFLDTPPGVMGVGEKLESIIYPDENYLILDEIKDPGNLGTIIRTADWFGLKNIIISKNSVDVYNPKVVQSTMGSLFRLNIAIDQDLNEFVNDLKGYKIIATSLDGSSELPNLKNEKYAIIMGSESNGINKELLKLATDLYKIPGEGNAESLNVAVATGIVLSKIK